MYSGGQNTSCSLRILCILFWWTEYRILSKKKNTDRIRTEYGQNTVITKRAIVITKRTPPRPSPAQWGSDQWSGNMPPLSAHSKSDSSMELHCPTQECGGAKHTERRWSTHAHPSAASCEQSQQRLYICGPHPAAGETPRQGERKSRGRTHPLGAVCTDRQWRSSATTSNAHAQADDRGRREYTHITT